MSKLLNDSSIATVTSLSGTEFLNPVDPTTGEISKITTNDAKTFFSGGGGSSSGPLVYASLIYQAGSSAPTDTIATNNIGATITYSRSSAGVYLATANNPVFTVGKTLVFLENIYDTPHIHAKAASTTTIQISSLDQSFNPADGMFNGNSFKIEIYP